MSHVPSLSPASWKAVPMDEVYLFKDGKNKFTPPPGKQPNRQFRIPLQRYLSSPSCAVSEFPLQMFSTSFQDLGLSKLMSHNKREDCDEIWEYNVVLLYPTNVQTNKAKVTRFKLATEAAGQFYRSRFEEYSSCSTIGSNNHGYWTSHCQRRRPFQKIHHCV
jgi:hypothetical protein